MVREASNEARVDPPSEGSHGPQRAARPRIVELADGARFDLEIAAVSQGIGGDIVRMLAYNGSIPGPTLVVPQGATVTINVTNHGDSEATVHWHGLRLDNRYDGTHETQPPIPVGGTFTYEVHCPDPGAYWYHPHVREDYNQEMGLYGNILVTPAEPDYWPPVHRTLMLTLDDLLIENGMIASFSESQTTHVAMGRFGNVMLVSGEAQYTLDARRGEVVRLYLTNTANTRVFNVALPGATMKLVGGDSGHCEREAMVDEVLLAPSERAVVDVLFRAEGEVALEHRTPGRTYRLAAITVEGELDGPSLEEPFTQLRINADVAQLRSWIAPFLEADPDKSLSFIAEMDMGEPTEAGPVIFGCPMHSEVVSEEPGRCPKCGMKLLPIALPSEFGCPMHPDVVSASPGRCPICGMKLVPSKLIVEAGGGPAGHGMHEEPGASHEVEPAAHEHLGHDQGSGPVKGIEWEDDMVEVNRITTPENTRWKLVDRRTGAENQAIAWTFRVGDSIKLRLVNELDSDHPMPHPFHIHGAGRFLILARDGVVEPNLMWKDTVLVGTGETVDILLDVTNPGRWMAHCHIAEHHEGGMMFSFDVVGPDAG